MDNQQLEEAIKLLRKARGLAVNAGAIGITLATAEDPAERHEMASYLSDFVDRFQSVIREALDHPLVRQESTETPQALTEIRAFAEVIAGLDRRNDFAALTREKACALTRQAREVMLPAIYKLIKKFENARDEADAKHSHRLRMQAVQLELMFGEVEQIGRMIHLISLNASVEAARAGGNSGRSFKVIADEIRSLAAKSSNLIDTTRAALRGNDANGGGYAATGRFHG